MGLAILVLLTLVLLTLWIGLAVVILKLNKIEGMIRHACAYKGIYF